MLSGSVSLVQDTSVSFWLGQARFGEVNRGLDNLRHIISRYTSLDQVRLG